ncbi:MAG: hypothetical protein BTN85_0204 [Candidatus Methanohalarchaeum thermophilum]|uniref:Uncharacterized protein n=1 Tax=Methanohalarchaeum thermophilum TaxID=1903181 RepID=A0A1Q6DTQ6_METT1|nr:MAG: hypothetical protein BTN85_0204 [Candidatus Methanohalarchaeum thermophilum]
MNWGSFIYPKTDALDTKRDAGKPLVLQAGGEL